MVRFSQMAFGKRKPMVKAKGRPLPRWKAKREEMRRQADARRRADEMKEIVFRANPDASVHTIYGTVLINGQEKKFSIDIVMDSYEISKQQMYNKLKQAYGKLYDGLIPKRHYYSFYFSPDHLLRGKWIPHEGLVRYMGKKIEYPRRKRRFGIWEPGRRKRRIIRKPRPWGEVRWRIARYRELITEAEEMIVYYRHKIRELGYPFRPYSAERIRRAEERYLREIGWEEEKKYWWKK